MQAIHFSLPKLNEIVWVSFIEQAVKMPEFWFYLTPKPYKNNFFSSKFALGS